MGTKKNNKERKRNQKEETIKNQWQETNKNLVKQIQQFNQSIIVERTA